MKTLYVMTLLLCSVSLFAGEAAMRTDAIWARTTTEAITLDGILDEASWAKAESVMVYYGQDGPLPGSGWYHENGNATPDDPTRAKLKFLVNNNQLYVAIEALDKSIGGGLFNKFDGFLMNLREHAKPDRPAPSFEYFYGWVTEGWADPKTGNVGALPGFFGMAAADRSVWNAATEVEGRTNDDSIIDYGYTTEFQFDLTVRGYDVVRAQGDIMEFNIQIYDADWQWPLDNDKFYGNRVWLQGPWGNASSFAIFSIYAKPEVTVSSGAVPVIPPDMIIPNADKQFSTIVDGKLDEEAWQTASGFDIRFGDDALRASYPGIGPFRSGQFQPKMNDITAVVLDPGDATFKWFTRGDMLYIGADVRDQVVWADASAMDKWDGIRIIINDRGAINPQEHNLERRELDLLFDETGKPKTTGYLPFLVDSLKGAQVGFALKDGSTINNFSDIDAGYTMEMGIDLYRLGYPAGLGDRVLFVSAMLFDYDAFENSKDNYGTRTWWMRQFGGDAGPAWVHMSLPTGVQEKPTVALPQELTLIGAYPNPFNPTTTISYNLNSAGQVKLQVFDVLGRTVSEIALGSQTAGTHKTQFTAADLSSGVYFYRLQWVSAANGLTHFSSTSKLMILK